MKRILLLVIGILVYWSLPAMACDPLGCLMGGKDQDALIIGRVTDLRDGDAAVDVLFTFPQSRLKPEERILVAQIEDAVIAPENAVYVNGIYFISLVQTETAFSPQWAVYELSGEDYRTTKLKHIRHADDAAIEVFINSGGTEQDFYFIGDKGFVRSNGKEIRIYPRIGAFQFFPSFDLRRMVIWTILVLVMIAGLSWSVLRLTKKGRPHRQ